MCNSCALLVIKIFQSTNPVIQKVQKVQNAKITYLGSKKKKIISNGQIYFCQTSYEPYIHVC